MIRQITLFIIAGLAGAIVLTANASASVKPVNQDCLQPRMAKVDIPFVANKGQLPDSVAFAANTFAGQVYVNGKGELTYRIPMAESPAKVPVSLQEVLIGGKAPPPQGINLSSSKINFFIGSDPSQWLKGVPAYDSISLGQVYEGISVSLKAKGNNVEKRFHVAPGTDPGLIRVKVKGASGLTISANGQLAIQTPAGTLELTAPVAFQEIDGHRQAVTVAYQVKGDTYGFSLGAYDKEHALVIDPMFATYLGGSKSETLYGLETNVINDGTDANLYVYVTGGTESRDFPGLAGGLQTTYGYGDKDAYVARLDMDLKVLETTYLGGRGEDIAYDLTIHPDTDNVYIIGATDSNNFPEAGSYSGETDAFITILSPDLSTIVASRYLGGSAKDQALGLDIDHREAPDTTPDSLYVVGRTMSTDFPVSSGAFQTLHGSSASVGDAFVARLNAETLSLMQATFLGANSTDYANDVVVHDFNHEVYAVLYSAYNPQQGLWVGSLPWVDNPADFGGQADAVVVRLNESLSTMINAVYVGGTAIDWGLAIAINYSLNRVYIAGGLSPRYDTTAKDWISDFPATAGGFQTDLNGDQESFIAYLGMDLVLQQATYLGGSDFERISDIRLSSTNSPTFDVYVIGTTQSDDFPNTEDGYSKPQGFYSAFVARLTPDLSSLHEATYLGGSGTDEAHMHSLDMANDPHNGAIWLFAGGQTSSKDFPAVLNTDTDTAAQPTNAGSIDGWVARLNPLYRSGYPDIELQPRSHDFGNQRLNTAAPPLTVTFDNLGTDPVNVSNIFLQGTEMSDYILDFAAGSTPCGTPPFDVASGEVCTVNVVFTPSVDNVYRQAQAVVQTGNDPDEPELFIDLIGYSGPDITIITYEPDTEPTVLFPLTQIGSTTTQAFTIQNDGYSDLVVSSILKMGIDTTTGEDFTFRYEGDFACPDPADGPFTLVPGANCAVRVDFTPTYAAFQEALAVIISNDIDESPQHVRLHGPGVEDLSADIWSHDVAFYDAPIGSMRSLPLIVSNTGGEVLEITGMTLSDNANFAIDSSGGANPCSSVGNELEPFSSCTMTAIFTPGVSATFDETLTLTSNDPDEADYVVHFTGRSDTDSDGDYVLDIEESGDANGDGTNDADQPNVASLHSREGNHLMVFESDGNNELRDVRTQTTPSDAPLAGFEYPFGFYHFRVILEAGSEGANVTMTVMNADGSPADDIDTYIKYGPTPGNPDYHYYDLGDQNGVTINGTSYPSHVSTAGNVVTLHLLDGGIGDSDDANGDGQGEVNGEITDPGAPALAVVIIDSDGDGVIDSEDNCPFAANAGQENADGDSFGDACDTCPNDTDNDTDGDGVCGDLDNCPAVANASQDDADNDTIGDACDTCPNDPDNDADGDGICDDVNNNPPQTNSSGGSGCFIKSL